MRYEVDLINLAQERVKWKALINSSRMYRRYLKIVKKKN
jgi:hypothetical protein